MKDEALKLALEALERLDLWLKARYSGIGLVGVELEAITAIKEALAQPAQEPLCYASINKQGDVCSTLKQRDSWRTVPLYTTPPQRTWVEPTGNEWFEWWRVSKVADATEAEIDFADFLIIAQAVSAKLKEKNNG